MSPEVHRLLLSCDVLGHWEHPPSSDWSRATQEVTQTVPQLESVLGKKLHVDTGVQDASFFADVGILVPNQDSAGIVYLSYEICFRFSWFSRLYTVHGSNWQDWNHAGSRAVLEQAGYLYVPEDELQEQYDGINVPYEPRLTWWTRYFDYL